MLFQRGLWPDLSDPRVDAIVPNAEDAFFFGHAGLTEIIVPVLAMGGTSDSDSLYMWEPTSNLRICFQPEEGEGYLA